MERLPGVTYAPLLDHPSAQPLGGIVTVGGILATVAMAVAITALVVLGVCLDCMPRRQKTLSKVRALRA